MTVAAHRWSSTVAGAAGTWRPSSRPPERPAAIATIGPAFSGPIRVSSGDRSEDERGPMDERLTDLTVRRLVERLATSDPVPGGGSAAALAGAMGAALIRMVVELTAGRPAAEGYTGELTEIGVAASGWQSELLNLAELDSTAYDAVVRARRLPRDSELEKQARATQVAAAVREATRAPLATAR